MNMSIVVCIQDRFTFMSSHSRPISIQLPVHRNSTAKQSGAEYRWHFIVRVKHFDGMSFCKVYSFPFKKSELKLLFPKIHGIVVLCFSQSLCKLWFASQYFHIVKSASSLESAVSYSHFRSNRVFGFLICFRGSTLTSLFVLISYHTNQ